MIVNGVDLEDDLNIFSDLEAAFERYDMVINEPSRFDSMVAEGRIKQAVAIELAENQRSPVGIPA